MASTSLLVGRGRRIAETELPPVFVTLKATEGTAARHTQVRFKRVELKNTLNWGRDSVDAGETYRRLGEISNDKLSLCSQFGDWLGMVVYAMPTWIKACQWNTQAQRAMSKNLEEHIWLAIDENDDGNTLGLISLTELDHQDEGLPRELDGKRVFNVGAHFLAVYRDQGLATQVSAHCLSQLSGMMESSSSHIDTLWISTMPQNLAVQKLAANLGFGEFTPHSRKVTGIYKVFQRQRELVAACKNMT
jgi:RimJ/RimL family protein N-acetyltransferase